jgi:hypothetical protein
LRQVKQILLMPQEDLPVLTIKQSPIYLAVGSALASLLVASNAAAQSLVDSDGDGMPDSVEAQEGTNPSLKDNVVFTNARFFVMQQYLDFQDRLGDASGIGYWTSQVDSGARSRVQFIEDNLNSAEFQAQTATVIRLYFAYFGRLPDTLGAKHWIKQKRSGTSLEAISDAFASSSEFQTKYGSLSNREFVRRVYGNDKNQRARRSGHRSWTVVR